MSKKSPQHIFAMMQREARGGRPQFPKTPKAPRAIDRPITLSDENINWVKSMVIYEDVEIIALNKPSNLSSQGGHGQGGQGRFHNLDELLWAFAKSNGKKPRLVHRLDRDTSGVMVVAKTQPSASFLGKAMMARQFSKTYLCIVANPKALADKGVVEVSLRREQDGQQSYSRVCDDDHPDALSAKTTYEVISRNEMAALVKCNPYTGRMHQIRVHLAHLGAPIAGDVRYGGALSLGGQAVGRLMLHAHSLEFPHPLGGIKRIDCPLSEDINALLDNIKLNQD